jgi:hypothetical protein
VTGGNNPWLLYYRDEKQVARMDSARYSSLRLNPGPHMFRSSDKQSGIHLELEEGQVYYIRVQIATGFLKGHGRLVLVQPEQGSLEIKKLKYLYADKNKGTAPRGDSHCRGEGSFGYPLCYWHEVWAEAQNNGGA